MFSLLPKEELNGSAWEMDHFPVRFQFVIFRNWNRIAVERIAETLNVSVKQIQIEAERLGLPPYDEKSCRTWIEYGYLTIHTPGCIIIIQTPIQHKYNTKAALLQAGLKIFYDFYT